MSNKLSKRLADIINALPLNENVRVLEIGCGTGAMAREISSRIKNGYILAIDRSYKAIQQAVKGSTQEIKTGKLSFRQVSVEEFKLEPNEKLFDIAVAIRVGALDGRHPEIEEKALQSIKKAMAKNGKLFIDRGNPLKEIFLERQ